LYKRIGIIGGLSPESTVLYYQHIVRRYYESFGNHSYPEIIIYSVNFQKYIDWAYEEQWPTVVEALLDLLGRLQRAGADFAVIACNTLHVVFDQVQRRSPIPLISIIDATAEKIMNEGINTVGLLGTSFTMEHQFYRDGLTQHGIRALIPNKASREYLDKIILEELSIGIIDSETREKVLTIIDDLTNEGAKGIVLGCTELPLLFKDNHVHRLFDTASIHAEKALQHAVRTSD
jgi:aspartate racemase